MTDEGVSKLPWDLIRAFLALDRHGDYAVAAEVERIDDSTLRRRIRTLEQRMGRALFVRTERGWKAAPDQIELVKAAQRMEEAASCFARPHQGSVAKIVKLEHAWRRLDGRNDDGFQVAPFPG